MTSEAATERFFRLKAPSLEELEALADAAYAALPSRFTRLCEGLVIRVEEFPDDDVLEEMDAET